MSKRNKIHEGFHRAGIVLAVVAAVVVFLKVGPTAPSPWEEPGLPEYLGTLIGSLIGGGIIYGFTRAVGWVVSWILFYKTEEPNGENPPKEN